VPARPNARSNRVRIRSEPRRVFATNRNASMHRAIQSIRSTWVFAIEQTVLVRETNHAQVASSLLCSAKLPLPPVQPPPEKTPPRRDVFFSNRRPCQSTATSRGSAVVFPLLVEDRILPPVQRMGYPGVDVFRRPIEIQTPKNAIRRQQNRRQTGIAAVMEDVCWLKRLAISQTARRVRWFSGTQKRSSYSRFLAYYAGSCNKNNRITPKRFRNCLGRRAIRAGSSVCGGSH